IEGNMEIEALKTIGKGLIDLINASGPYAVALVGAYFGYLGNKSAKEMSLKVTEMQIDKDLNVQRESHKFESKKVVSQYKRELIDKIVKELEPMFTRTVGLIKSYHALCAYDEPFNQEKFRILIQDRFFNVDDLDKQSENDRAFTCVLAYTSLISDANISVEVLKLQDAISQCVMVVEWDGENWGEEHTQKVNNLMSNLQASYMKLFISLGKSLEK
ncbi:hypothetical protein, partial [Vibrio alginolyticus]